MSKMTQQAFTHNSWKYHINTIKQWKKKKKGTSNGLAKICIIDSISLLNAQYRLTINKYKSVPTAKIALYLAGKWE